MAERSQRPAAAPPSAEVLGIPLAVADYTAVLDLMDAVVDLGERAYVTAAAVHLVMLAQEPGPTRDAVLGATLAVPDGQPLVWALHALGHPEATRVYGPELMARHCARAAQTGRRIYLYGGQDAGALVRLSVNLRTRFPGLQIVGAYSPPFRPLTDAEDEWTAAEIDRSGAEIVWVGTGQPKQEHWMWRMRERIAAPLLVGVGAAFNFHAGLVAQAPAWMGPAGLEWTFRLAAEPRRLWRRYAVHNPRFVAGFARQYAAQRGLPAQRRLPGSGRPR
jgi:N-acetylglucosaminyldiphosphoundecaprenol N-acetyl-beta-D-mannosaminyltransferase